MGYFDQDTGLYVPDDNPKDIYGTPLTGDQKSRVRSREESRRGKTREQIAREIAGTRPVRRKAPKTKRGIALKELGSEWVEEDFKAEAEEKGCSVFDLPGYSEATKATNSERRAAGTLERFGDDVGKMTPRQKAQAYQMLVGSGFEPGQAGE